MLIIFQILLSSEITFINKFLVITVSEKEGETNKKTSATALEVLLLYIKWYEMHYEDGDQEKYLI